MREGGTRTRGMVLAYHEVMPESNYSYCVTRESFAAQIGLIGALAQEGAGDHAVVTFDDGEQSQLQNAANLLREAGISATYFVNPGLAGMEPKFLTWTQLRDLQSDGHSVQSHGWSHKFLVSCSDEELMHEVAGSRESLEDKLGSLVDEISMPGGRWDARVIGACARAGYKRVYVSDPWIATEMSGVQVIGRFMVRRTTGLPELKKMIQRDRRVLWTMKMRSQV